MIISTMLHVVSVLSLGWLYLLFPLNVLYPACVVVIGMLFIVEHRLVHPDDLSRINIAFFNVNSVISVLVLAAVFFGTVL
jgi:4-hydroxybenzoate polyprenyltransferase